MRLALVSLVALVACSDAPQNGTAAQASSPSSSAPVCASAPSFSVAPSGPTHDALDEALAKLSLDRTSFSLSANAIAQNGLMPPRDPRRLADLDAYGRAPVTTAAWGAALARLMDQASTSAHPVSDLLAIAQARRGTVGDAPVAPSCTSGVLASAADPTPLATALATVNAAPADWSQVALDLQRALVPIVLATAHASQVVAAERAKVAPFSNELNAVPSWLLGSYKLALRPELTTAMESFGLDAITSSAREVTLAIESANLGQFHGVHAPHVEVATEYGAFVLSGPSSDTFTTGHPWLIVDTGGDDVYRSPVGGAYLGQAVAIAIDLGGDDTYGYEPVPASGDGGHRLPSDGQGRVSGQTRSRIIRQGAAVLGIGMLFDLGGGNDHRRSLALSQGSAVLGVGICYDDGGDDVYESEIFSQGASAWGVGLLVDRGGNDRYVAYKEAQGFGGPRGVGALVDDAGNDSYSTDSGMTSLGGDPIYPSAQIPGASNESYAQGCGAGRRPDGPDVGFPFPGGLGVLRDRAGDDVYSASVFAQGCGFAMGMGALLDGAGNDTYDALYYAQGAGLHLSAAVMIDGAGDDRYDTILPANAAMLGLGHDVSVGVMADLDGDDTVHAPVIAAGAGIANGLGLMLASRGSDNFQALHGGAWGVAAAASPLTPWRTTEKTVGVFVRADGGSKYTGEEALESGGTSARHEGPLSSIGLDRPTSQIVLP